MKNIMGYSILIQLKIVTRFASSLIERLSSLSGSSFAALLADLNRTLSFLKIGMFFFKVYRFEVNQKTISTYNELGCHFLALMPATV